MTPQHAGPRPRFFDNRPQEFFRKVGIGVAAEGDLRQTKKVRQRPLPLTRRVPLRGPGTPRHTAPDP
jgi:hypothetical protein